MADLEPAEISKLDFFLLINMRSHINNEPTNFEIVFLNNWNKNKIKKSHINNEPTNFANRFFSHSHSVSLSLLFHTIIWDETHQRPHY
jgi:hypothetical protein